MDIKHDEQGDIDFSTGDIRYGVVSEQFKRTLLVCGKADMKHSPVTGIGVTNYLLDDSPSGMLRETRRQCVNAGINIEKVYADTDGTIHINGLHPDDK